MKVQQILPEHLQEHLNLEELKVGKGWFLQMALNPE